MTNHVADKNAGVFAYEIPSKPTSEAWPKHVLYQGFVTAPGPGQASPGFAELFPMSKDPNKKMSIVVSGDGTQRAHILTPVCNDPNNWEYKEETILKSKGMVGKIAIADTNQNGILELFIPEYSENKITVLEPILD